MPCIKCSNGKWKFGEKGKCSFKTKEACETAGSVIHADKGDKKDDKQTKSK